MKTRYKFLREIDGKIKSDSGNTIWKIGEWKHKDEINMCKAGFHCSKTKYQAFSYVQGEVLAEVEVKGKHESQDDKEVWSDMRIIKAWKWQKKDSVALAIFSAELCLDNFEKVYPKDKRPREAIEAAKKWLNGKITDKELEAAESAAWSAWSAVRSAESAESAESAAESAAWSAARSAARSAESAAWSAESAESAARSAESAARSAAESAESAAWSAESAVRSAESAAIKKITKWIEERELDDYKS